MDSGGCVVSLRKPDEKPAEVVLKHRKATPNVNSFLITYYNYTPYKVQDVPLASFFSSRIQKYPKIHFPMVSYHCYPGKLPPPRRCLKLQKP